ncbi:MAG: cation-translocating P-type ATPase [Candidatus Omnitrophota bacterium]|nr:cation-translocating P-type ATPase [Candidatus Omnitrophota bacterium]
MKSWYQLDVAAALKEMGVDASCGLSAQEASARLSRYGNNELAQGKRVSAWSLLFQQFQNVLIIILLIATVLSIFLGHGVEAAVILVIVLFAIVLGFVQEYRAERAIEALRKMAALTAKIIRDGNEIEIPALGVVPGDIVLLRAGDRVPADGRLIEAVNLQAEEAVLTGESLPVEKSISPLCGVDLGIGDRKNIVYSGTVISYGRGKAVVVATGMNTEFGKITGMLQHVETARTPLQKNLDRLGKSLAKAAIFIVLIIIGLGVFRGQPVLEMLIFGIALAVAVVPEALPAVVTISLAIGVQRMAKRNALVRRLPAVETLGSTTVICSDKTGTLTKDEMTVRRIYDGNKFFDLSGSGYEPSGQFLSDGSVINPGSELIKLLQAGALASDARLIQKDGRWVIKGDPTEGALVTAAAKAGLNKKDLEEDFPRIHEIPFTSESKRMTTVHRTSMGVVAFSKGAPEIIMTLCRNRLTSEAVLPLTTQESERILTIAQDMASKALRVLGIAYKPNATAADAERDMVFLGLVGMIDPPRPEAKKAVELCKQAGIFPVMITGDHPATALAVAKEIGLLQSGRVVIGSELEAMSDEELFRQIENTSVYARVSPAHKLRIVTALQKKGHIVAMTGDGINDAPALKKADIGIAMGITGTDVSKEVASMTLIDDNFASIVAAVEEGRHIFDNIKKYLMYLLSSNIGEIGLMAGAALFGLPLPLTAVQILYVNLATDGLPALALAVDNPSPDLMARRPRNAKSGIFTKPIVFLMGVGGAWSTIINLSVFFWALKTGFQLREAMTMTFISLVLVQFFKAYSFRSDRHSILRRPFANKWLNLSVGWELVLLLLIVYVPSLNKLFGTFTLPLRDWVIVAGLAFTVVPILELAKFTANRWWGAK